MKLKGLLKGLCIFGLTLLPISFSSAGSTCFEFDIPDTFVLNKSTVLTFNNLNFSTYINGNNLEHIIYLTVPSSAPSSLQSLKSLFGYYNGQPYLYSAYHQSNSSHDIYQGFATNVYVESIDTFDVSHITYNTTYKSIDTFLNANGFNGGIVCATDGNSILNEPFVYCFKNSTDYYCFKVSAYGGDQPVSTFNTLSGSLGLTTNADFTNINSIEWSVSPFNSVIDNPPTVVDPRNSAQNIYDSYRKMGYSDVLCYGGFSIDDKFGTGNSSLNGIKIGSGAFITDLYNSYPYDVFDGSELNIVDWYNSWDFEYGFFVDQHDLNEFSYYEGLSRGFVGLFMARDYFFKGSNFDPAMLISFCNFSRANDTLINKSQTPIDIVNDTINESELNKLIGNIGIIKPGSGSALDVVAKFVSGYNEDDYYSLFLSGFDIVESVEIPDIEYPGMLPTYIVAGFLGFMLLYVLRH